MFLSLFRSLLVACVLMGGSIGLLQAAETAAPDGPVILTVSGPLARTNAGAEMQYDLDMLRAMGSSSFETSTIWTEGTHVFTGVPLRDLLMDLGIESGMLQATAINDYTVEIPVSDALVSAALVAYEMDGKPMARRDKGPLWIVYPYDADARWRSEVIYTRSIWQLDRLQVLE
ncbi:molybdopterin-dependent oxidoreductase [Seohaeicola saemankumensis]|nr:molybdopterin-dependent oxidoreductase [Seohaeicola saemankumensis]MCA0872926.1 molybdopterin-dependent oxidoreductase [Seohaeicola saemankumensis]